MILFPENFNIKNYCDKLLFSCKLSKSHPQPYFVQGMNFTMMTIHKPVKYKNSMKDWYFVNDFIIWHHLFLERSFLFFSVKQTQAMVRLFPHIRLTKLLSVHATPSIDQFHVLLWTFPKIFFISNPVLVWQFSL